MADQNSEKQPLSAAEITKRLSSRCEFLSGFISISTEERDFLLSMLQPPAGKNGERLRGVSTLAPWIENLSEDYKRALREYLCEPPAASAVREAEGELVQARNDAALDNEVLRHDAMMAESRATRAEARVTELEKREDLLERTLDDKWRTRKYIVCREYQLADMMAITWRLMDWNDELKADRDEARIALLETVDQSCCGHDGKLDSMALSVYAYALRVLARHDYVEIEKDIGRRVIATVTNKGKAALAECGEGE